MYKRILVAIDSSTTAQRALDEAIQLARACGSSLCIATALDERPLAQHALGIGTFIDAEKVEAEMRSVGDRLLDMAITRAAQAGISAERQLLESEQKRTAEQIAEGARQWGADLIVVGTHGRRGFDRILVGSVAENLLRLAGTSVLMVRGS
jgi:nucleotide-binding universal stress UspA family protein